MGHDLSHISHVQVQLGEDDLGESLLHGCPTTAVEGLGVTQQLQGGQEELTAGVELAGGVGQLATDFIPLPLDRSQLLLDLVPGPVRVAE
ncbi:hypothetical protein L6E12_03830 [Actinokineospora sp. PR83]|uniref:hypothetical protein n=1 Tax=Actinokineospora sp. PR83 TaxID=2884908 RepID=UPI001F1925CE|nr:hypothetical protein [Actinokineospora sp. PR83]MCG8914919.1 hypothetical protein [Actinokineospora sp. PR83]